jgi:hypothetical protein
VETLSKNRMLDKTNQNQSSGENSQNIQVSGNLIIGITEQRAREISIEIYKDNFIKLSQEAYETATYRVEELVDDFLVKLQERNPNSLDSLKEPGMQAALYNAQKEYAKTGDKNLEETLVDMLVDRAAIKERNLKQIVLDESISTVSKLTSEQLDILTLIFILTRTQSNTVNNLASFTDYLKSYLVPFISSVTKEKSAFEHLNYSGCCSFMGIAYDEKLENILKERYQAFFLKGFTKEDFENLVGKMEDFHDLIIPCFQFPEKFQLNLMTSEKLDETAKAKGIDISIIEKMKLTYSEESRLTSDEAKTFILNNVPELAMLLEMWGDSDMHATALTSVGIAIAQANFRRKTGKAFDLSIWIK